MILSLSSILARADVLIGESMEMWNILYHLTTMYFYIIAEPIITIHLVFLLVCLGVSFVGCVTFTALFRKCTVYHKFYCKLAYVLTYDTDEVLSTELRTGKF